MKKTLPFLLLVVCALGCSKFGPDTASTSNANSANTNAAPAKPVKVVDMPAMVGKSRADIKKMVEAAPKNEEPWLEYKLPQGDLTIQFTKEKPSRLTFDFKAVSIGDATISGLDTADNLATMAGIDVSGKTPTYTSESFENFDYEIGGKKTEVSFHKISGRYTSVSINAK